MVYLWIVAQSTAALGAALQGEVKAEPLHCATAPKTVVEGDKLVATPLGKLGLAYSFPRELGESLGQTSGIGRLRTPEPGTKNKEQRKKILATYCGREVEENEPLSAPLGDCAAARVRIAPNGALSFFAGGTEGSFCLEGEPDAWGKTIVVRVRASIRGEFEDRCFFAHLNTRYQVPDTSTKAPTAEIRIFAQRPQDVGEAPSSLRDLLKAQVRVYTYQRWARKVYDHVTTTPPSAPQAGYAQRRKDATKALQTAKEHLAKAEVNVARAVVVIAKFDVAIAAAQRAQAEASSQAKELQARAEAEIDPAKKESLLSAAKLKLAAAELAKREAEEQQRNKVVAEAQKVEQSARQQAASALAIQRQKEFDGVNQAQPEPASAWQFAPLLDTFRRELLTDLQDLGKDAFDVAYDAVGEALQNLSVDKLDSLSKDQLCDYVRGEPPAAIADVRPPYVLARESRENLEETLPVHLYPVAVRHQPAQSPALPGLLLAAQFPAKDGVGQVIDLASGEGRSPKEAEYYQDQRLVFFARNLAVKTGTAPGESAAIMRGDRILIQSDLADIVAVIIAVAVSEKDKLLVVHPASPLEPSSRPVVVEEPPWSGVRDCDSSCKEELKAAAEAIIKALGEGKLANSIDFAKAQTARLTSAVRLSGPLEGGYHYEMRICRGQNCTAKPAANDAADSGPAKPGRPEKRIDSDNEEVTASFAFRVRERHRRISAVTELGAFIKPASSLPLGGFTYEPVGGATGPDQLYELQRHDEAARQITLSELLVIYPLPLFKLDRYCGGPRNISCQAYRWLEGFAIGAGPSFLAGSDAKWLAQWNLRLGFEIPDSGVLLTVGPSWRYVQVPTYTPEGTVVSVPRASGVPAAPATNEQLQIGATIGVAIDLSLISEAAKGVVNLFKAKGK